MKLFALLTLSLFVISLASCTKKETATLASPTPEASNVLLTPGKVLAKTEPSELPFNMYRFMAADPKNLCLSPLSLEQAFEMVYLGSNGKTKTMIEELFGFKGNELYSLKSEDLSKEIEFLWGNSIWAKPNKSLSPSYVEAAKKAVDASYMQSLDVSKMNAWISKITHDKIRDLIKHVDLSTITVLINALYLNAPWEKPFDAKANLLGNFESNPHMASRVVFLSRKASFNYFENDSSKWIELPYAGGTLSMILALPKKKFDFRAIEEALSTKLIRQVTEGFTREFVDLKMPKFKMESVQSLSKVFENMGYADLFKKGDYSRMTLLPEVKISEILQATYLKVDEKGTEAAAATAVAMEGTSAPLFREPKTFYANQPFLFLIRNKKSSKIYFVGRLYDPASK